MREHVCLPVKRIFPAVKLCPQTPPIDKKEIGDATIPGERRIHTSPSATNPPPPHPQLGPLADERAVSSDVTLWRCTFLSGKFASLSSRSLARHAPSIYLVLWLCGYRYALEIRTLIKYRSSRKIDRIL